MTAVRVSHPFSDAVKTPSWGTTPCGRLCDPVLVARTSATPRRDGVNAKRAAPKGRPFAGVTVCAGTDDYRSSDRTDCGAWLACASMLVPACCRIWDFVNSTISLAMSTSRMRLSALIRFSW